MPYYKKGFTFLEIVIVVLVIGILAAIAMPKFVELRNEAINNVEKYTAGSIRTGIANWHAKSFISTAGSATFPTALDLATLGNAAPANPLFTEVLQPAIVAQWRKTGPHSYFGSVREYSYDKTNGTFEPVSLGDDLSAFINNGTAMNGAAQTTDSPYGIGTSIALDGVNDYISVPDSDNWNFTSSDGTIEFWLKADTLKTANLVSQVGSDFNWTIYTYGNGSIATGKAGVNEIASSPGLISTDAWNHVAVVKDGSTTTIYLNGNNVVSGNIPMWTDAANPLLIGGHVDPVNVPYYFDGSMADVRVSDIARYTSSFTPPTEPLVADDNTVGLWR